MHVYVCVKLESQVCMICGTNRTKKISSESVLNAHSRSDHGIPAPLQQQV